MGLISATRKLVWLFFFSTAVSLCFTITFRKPYSFTDLPYVPPTVFSSCVWNCGYCITLTPYFLVGGGGGGGGTSPNDDLQDTLPTDCRLLLGNPLPLKKLDQDCRTPLPPTPQKLRTGLIFLSWSK